MSEISQNFFRDLETGRFLGRFLPVLRSFCIVLLALRRLQTDLFQGAHAREVVGSHRQHK
jgi:hypothetical protein